MTVSAFHRQARLRLGFTLVELLVVIAIIGILVGLLLPAVQAAREAARRMQCVNNMKQVALSFHLHHDSHSKLPPGNTSYGDAPGGDGPAYEAIWTVYILPYIEQGSLYDKADMNRAFGHGSASHPNTVITAAELGTLRCPSDRSDIDPWLGGFSHHSYSANNGIGPNREGHFSQATLRNYEDMGVFYLDSELRFADLVDGTSNTIVLSEILNVRPKGGVSDQRGAFYPEGAFYHHNYTPNDLTPDQTRNGHCVSTEKAPCIGAFNSAGDRQLLSTARSSHSGGVNVAMGDGSVKFVSDTVALNVWRAAGTPEAITGEITSGGL